MTETPQEFDLEAWIDGAERPRHSVTVYQRAGLIAELDALEARIENAELDESGQIYERSIGERCESDKLRVEYAKLAQQFHDSALTFTVQGHDTAEKQAIADANPGLTAKELGYIVIADGIVSPKVTAEQLKRIESKIGSAQFDQIPVAYHRASTEIPSVSADFLPKRSTPADGGES